MRVKEPTQWCHSAIRLAGWAEDIAAQDEVGASDGAEK